MSRIGNNPIKVPGGVQVTVTPEMAIQIKGPKGQLDLDTGKRVNLNYENDEITVQRHDDSKQNRAYHGLYQRLIRNMVIGVTDGFSKELEIEGVGYRAEGSGNSITLNLGYSHPIKFDAPEGITLQATDANHVVVTGYDKAKVGQVAADIRALRPPEPYKGKGVRYKGEYIRRKVGKTGA
ncbi:MAG: 50S ribosomal protein L6 [Candidatus Sumerlaeia bacterium]